MCRSSAACSDPVRIARIRLMSAILLSFGLGFIPSMFESKAVFKVVTVLQQPVFFYMSWAFFQFMEARNWKLGWHVFYRVLALIVWIPFVIFNASILFSLIVTVKVCKEIKDKKIPNNGGPESDFLRDIAATCKKLENSVSLDTLRHSECFLTVQTVVSVIILGAFGFEMYRFIRRRRDYEAIEVIVLQSDEEEVPAYELEQSKM